MSLHKETVVTILRLCSHFNLNDEVIFSCLDTFKVLSNIIHTDTIRRIHIEFNRFIQENGHIANERLLEKWTIIKSTAFNSVHNTILLDILMVLYICTKYIDGPRSRKLMNYRRFVVLLEKTNKKCTLQFAREYEFKIFKCLAFKTEPPRAFYTICFIVRKCAIDFNYSYQNLYNISMRILRLAYINQSAIYERHRHKFTSSTFDIFCADNVLLGTSSVYTAILLTTNSSRIRTVILEAISIEINRASTDVRILSEFLYSVVIQ